MANPFGAQRRLLAAQPSRGGESSDCFDSRERTINFEKFLWDAALQASFAPRDTDLYSNIISLDASLLAKQGQFFLTLRNATKME